MDKKNKITLAVIIAITLIMIGLIVVGVITKGKTDKPDVTTPAETTDTISTSPVVPPVTDDGQGNGEETKPDNPGEVVIDIIKENEEHKREPEPGVIGDVVIIPGVKDEGEAN